MDPIKNPYAPGAGTPPPILAGRDHLREQVRVAIERTRNGKPSKSLLMVGLRGVGKTVLLNKMRQHAESMGNETFLVEAPEGRSLPSMLAPNIRQVLLKLSKKEKTKKLAQQALRGLAGFVKGLKLKYADLEVALDFEPEPGLADNGILEDDLLMLLTLVGKACRHNHAALAMFVDELQYVPEEQLAALITGLHRLNQEQLPVILIGAGLPQLRGRMGKAKSYAERLFDFPEVGTLSPEDAAVAIEEPALAENVKFTKEAVERILEETGRYPYFLQEWGKQVWDVASNSPIGPRDVDNASQLAINGLDESFFRVRFDRTTPAEKRYLRTMAELGPGPHRSGDIAKELNREVNSLAPVRNKLIAKGMVWSPSHGDTAFTVPMFDQYLKRIMPGHQWKD